MGFFGWTILLWTGWPADLEFLKTWKSQGILLMQKEYRQGFFKIHSSGEQELVMPINGFLSKNKNEFKLRNSLFFSSWVRKCTITD